MLSLPERDGEKKIKKCYCLFRPGDLAREAEGFMCISKTLRKMMGQRKPHLGKYVEEVGPPEKDMEGK